MTTKHKILVCVWIIMRYVLTMIISFYVLYVILSQLSPLEDIVSRQSFPSWLISLVKGDLVTNNYQKPIVFLANQIQVQDNIEVIGPAFFQTIGLAIAGLVSGYVLSIGLNFLLVFTKSIAQQSISLIVKTLEFFSGIHIIISGLGVYLIFKLDTPYFLLLVMLAIASNVFYDFSSEQSIEIKKLLDKDFIVAARAWGDSIWKHIKRSVGILSVTQLASMWMTLLTNALIIEIIFQRKGLGSLIYQNIFAPNMGSLVVETNILLVITMSIVAIVSLGGAAKEILTFYLIKIKR